MCPRRFRSILLVLIGIGIGLGSMASVVSGSPVLIPINGTVDTANTTFRLQSHIVNEVNPNTTEVYEINATNIGNRSGSLTVRLNIDNTTVNATTVTLQPHASTEVTLTTVFTDPGTYEVSINTFDSVEVDVLSCPRNNPLTDPDSDGLYEDVSGDCEFGLNDVAVLYANLDSDYVSNRTRWFDFDNNGKITLNDVTVLFEEYGTKMVNSS